VVIWLKLSFHLSRGASRFAARQGRGVVWLVAFRFFLFVKILSGDLFTLPVAWPGSKAIGLFSATCSSPAGWTVYMANHFATVP
jgi:hypothetical protein